MYNSSHSKNEGSESSDLPMSNLFNRISEKNKSRLLLAAPVILITGFCCLLAYKKQYAKKLKKKRGRHLTRSVSMGLLHGGKLAMERLLEIHAVYDAEYRLKKLLREEPHDFKEMQRIIGKLEMTYKEAEGITILKGAVKDADDQGKPHEAYEIQMLLVEMLIYKGEYQKAWDCECLHHKDISDARRPLYKAVITLLRDIDNVNAARKHWDSYQEIKSHFIRSDSFQEDPSSEFEIDLTQFIEVVRSLKKQIAAAQKLTR